VGNHKVGIMIWWLILYNPTKIDFIPENLEAVSDENGERFHQDISTMDNWYQGKWSPRMLDDYCWTLKGDIPQAKYKKAIHCYFLGNVYSL